MIAEIGIENPSDAEYDLILMNNIVSSNTITEQGLSKSPVLTSESVEQTRVNLSITISQIT